jgi:SAM-dependent methyltransferase
MSEYYLFPFECTGRNSRIVLYGAGKVGWHYLRQIEETGYCTCVAVVDAYVTTETARFDEMKDRGVQRPDSVNLLNFEHVVVAAAQEHNAKEICAELIKYGVPEEKIVSRLCKIDIPDASQIFEATPDPKNTSAWDKYYEGAEKLAPAQYERFIKPILLRYGDISFENVLDFACGHGRMANIFATFSDKLTCCDVNGTAIAFCKERFQGAAFRCVFDFAVNTVKEFETEPLKFAEEVFTFVYSWDAMVHFSYKWLDFYLSEFYRMLRKNGYTLLHHSNYGAVDDGRPKSEIFSRNNGWRALVTAEDVAFMARKHGFTVCEQIFIDGEDVLKRDCISLLKK